MTGRLTASGYVPIVLTIAILAVLPFGFSANTTLNFLGFVLIVTLAAQGWNLLAAMAGSFRSAMPPSSAWVPMAWPLARSGSG